MSTRRDDPRDEDLAALLGELETTLERLREALDERERPREHEDDGVRGRERVDRRRPLPEPPGVGDVARFTSDYTIPTVVAVLEATIRALELVGSLLRLLDPERSLGDDRSRDRGGAGPGLLDRSRARPALDRTVDSVGSTALDGLDRALSELDRALSEADLPEDPDARSVVEEARDLAAEVEARVADAEARRTGERDRDREYDRRARTRDRPDRDGGRRGSRDRRDRTDDGAIRIVVDDEAPDSGRERDAGESTASDDAETGDATDDGGDVSVDVEAELESIREEVRGRDGTDDDVDGGSTGEDADGGSTGEDADGGSTGEDADGGSTGRVDDADDEE